MNMEALTAAALARRFGGSLIAQQAAEKALLSRQASAESSAASAGATPRDTSEDGSKKTHRPPGEEAANDDDEALLLSGLLNRTSGAAPGEKGGSHQLVSQALPGRLLERQRAAIPSVALVPEDEKEEGSTGAGGAAAAPHVGATCGSMRQRSDSGSQTKELPPASAEQEGDEEAEGDNSFYMADAAAAATAGAGRRPPQQAPEPPRRHSIASAAEEEDTVLTGSPVGSSPVGGISVGCSPEAGRPVGGSPVGGGPVPGSAGDSPPASRPGGLGIKTIAAAEWLRAGAAPGKAAPAASSRGTPAPKQQLQAAAQAAWQPPPCAKVPKEAIRQRQWSFADIPRGTASIPSKASSSGSGSGSARLGRPGSGRAGAAPSKPAFYPRAASPPLRASSAPPAAGKGSSSTGGQAGSSRGSTAAAAQLRRQRLEQLAQPRHGGQQRRQHPCRRQAAAAAGLPAGAESGSPGAGCPLPAGEPKVPLLPHSSQGAECIPAWGGKQAGLPKRPEREQAQHAQPLSHPTKCSSTSTTSSSMHWPQSLGKRLDPAELQRATGAYSEDRFNRHLSQLRDTLAARQAQRRHAADATVAGVDELVSRVRQLGSRTGIGCGMHTACGVYHEPAAVGASSAAAVGASTDAGAAAVGASSAAAVGASAYAGAAAVGASADAGADPAEQEPHRCRQPGVAAEGRAPLPEHGFPGQMEGGSYTLPQSPTGKLVHCQELLLQRPVTAPQRGSQQPPLSPHLFRPATGSPGRVKPLMQVKREQDRAIQQLGAAQQAFRASPLPLSTMEPCYQQEVEQREQRRQAGHEQRRQQLREQQRPFGFDEREAERRERRLLLQASRQGMTAGAQVTACVSTREAISRPVTPSTFHAQPVPLSTSEARYALLVAEMQLQNRWVKGRGVSSPTGRRPGTAAPVPAAEQLCPPTAPAASASWRGAGTAAGERSQPMMTSPCCSGSSAGGTAAWAHAAAAAAGEGLAAEAQARPGAAPEAVTGWRPGTAGALSGAAHSPGHSTCQVGSAMQPAEASGLHAAGECCPAGTEPAGHDDSMHSAAPQPMAAAARSLVQPRVAVPDAASDSDEVDAGEGSKLQSPAASSCSPALLALRKNNSSPAGPGAAAVVAGEAPAAAAVSGAEEEEEAPLPPRHQPRQTESSQCRASCGSSSSWGQDEAAAAPPHKGSSSPAQPSRSGEPGIAVPVCILPVCRAAMAAAGGGAELLAVAELPAARGSAAQGPQPASPQAAAGQLRRDTPPQHIAARYRQAEAVARREVQMLLQKRGSGIVSLMQQRDGPL